MQYLFKVSSHSAPRWRLVALDGAYTLAEAGELIAAAFAYVPGPRSFVHQGKHYAAGNSGKEDSVQAQMPLDGLHLQAGDSLTFQSGAQGFFHQVEVMRAEEHLYCLMPSCLVGAGLVPEDIAGDEAALAAYADTDEAESLDLRECTKRMRNYMMNKRHQGSTPALQVPFASV
ncbi:MAG: hypothetical protein IAA31_05450 [Candidatus Anaerobiospirillum merdipullorum]|uniref:Uncharacterized protein n=1 Tax=Candidatus Anaerobiospirillum merdipullorum TaxID=2838450 RepID=A0A9E2KPY8_9GAMM|nr:hypothetical protein [Candidatus Anaerobiospirillum merdipullorum]